MANTRQGVYRRKRRAEGKCGWDGCPEVTGDVYYCATHQDRHNAQRRQRRLGAAGARMGLQNGTRGAHA